MSYICSNDPRFKDLVSALGEYEAYSVWAANNYEVPDTIQEAIKLRDLVIKPKIGSKKAVEAFNTNYNKLTTNGRIDYTGNAITKEVERYKELFGTKVRAVKVDDTSYTILVEKLVSKELDIDLLPFTDINPNQPSNNVNYQLKLVNGLNKLQRNKFESSKLQGWLNDLTKSSVPKEQLELFKAIAKDGMSKDDILTEILANYSYTIEINIAKEPSQNYDMVDTTGEGNFEPQEFIPDTDYVEEYDAEGNIIGMKEVLSEKGKKQIEEKENKRKPTQHHSNLTVAGGTNYTENAIRTVGIVNSISANGGYHDNEFNQSRGDMAGWFRSDEQAVVGTQETYFEEDDETMTFKKATKGGIATKTRRILEVQSFFQKVRDKDSLILNENEATKKKMWELKTLLKNRVETLENFKRLYPEQVDEIKKREKEIEGNKAVIEAFEKPTQNQFLQLLNKDNNWVTFFIKSIIQDSAKKGYEKVLFPRLDTIIQIESAGRFKSYAEADAYFEKESNWKQKLKELKEEQKDIIKQINEIKNSNKNEYKYGNKLLTKEQELERVNKYLIQNKEEIQSSTPNLLKTAQFYENIVTNILRKQFGAQLITTDKFLSDVFTPNGFQIVFGHPTIGKTYLKNNKDKSFITLDDDYADEINSFIDSNRGKETRQEYKGRKPKEYNDFMNNLFNKVKKIAKDQNKPLLISNTNVLKSNAEQFDIIINIPKDEFKRRFDARGATYGFEDWKSDIDTVISNIKTFNKITDEYGNTWNEVTITNSNLNDIDLLPSIDESNETVVVTLDYSNYVNHSGGAIGSDSVWEDIGKEFGMVNNRHYWTGTKTPRGNTEISTTDFNEGRFESAKAAKRNFGYQYAAMKDSRLIRNWSQVKHSDAIFAIGKIVSTGEKIFPNQKNDTRVAMAPSVTGGTGYAVGMGINHNKPVYVFNQTETKDYLIGWYQWNNEANNFISIPTPTLTKNFAGIGTREINELGKQAIRDIYSNGTNTVKDTPFEKPEVFEIPEVPDLNDIANELGLESANIYFNPYDDIEYPDIPSLEDELENNRATFFPEDLPNLSGAVEAVNQDIPVASNNAPVDLDNLRTLDLSTALIIPGLEGKSQEQYDIVQLIAYASVATNTPLEEVKEEYIAKIINTHPAIKAAYDNWEITEKLVNGFVGNLKDIFELVDSDLIEAYLTDEINDVEGIEDSDEKEKNNYNDQVGKENPNSTIQNKLKAKLAFIKDYELEDGKPIKNDKGQYKAKKNSIGMPKIVPLHVVLEGTKAMLAGQANNYNALEQKMQEQIQYKSWLLGVINALKDSKDKDGKVIQDNSQLRAQFTRWATGHYIDLKMLIWSTDYNDNVSTRFMSLDQSNLQKRLINQFNEEWMNSPAGLESSVSKRVEVLKEIAKEMSDIAVNYAKSNDTNKAIKDIHKALEKIGIVVPLDVIYQLQKLSDSKVYYVTSGSNNKYLDFKQQFTSNAGIFKNIISGINSLVTSYELLLDEQKESDDEKVELDVTAFSNPLWNNKGITNFVDFYAQFIDSAYTHSYKNANNDIIFSYSLNKYFNLKLDKLLKSDSSNENFSNSYLDRLLQTPFNNASIFLNKIRDNIVFRNTIELFYVDSIKESGKYAKHISKLNSRELEFFKLNSFFNGNRSFIISGQAYRVGNMFGLTMSDKETLMGIKTVLHNTRIQIDPTTDIVSLRTSNDANDNSLEAMMSLVLSEYNRIVYSQELESINISGYKDGASKFIVFNALNKESTFGNELSAVLRERLYIGDKLRSLEAIKADGTYQLLEEYMQSVFYSLYQATIASWLENEFIEKNGVSYSNKMLNSEYLEFVKTKFGQDKDKSSKAIQYAAADYVLNSLITNFNMFNMVTGDPALYFKKSSSQNIDDNIASTLINLGKRLALLNAPGYEGDLSLFHGTPQDSKTYNHLTVDDFETASLAKVFIAKLFGKDTKYNQKDGINVADAQGLTTLEEHARMLAMHGYISKEEYYTVLDNYTNLPEELLSKLTQPLGQPMKPVHVSNTIDDVLNTELVNYIKNSRFPLIPELVKGTPLDDIRTILEGDATKINRDTNFKKHIQTLDFKSGQKLGAKLVDGKLPKLFKQDGTIDISLDVSPWVVSLDRSGTRIQQEVPYNKNKKEITRSSQVDNNLFTGFMDIDGFELPAWMNDNTSRSGAQLKQKYLEIQEEIFKEALEDFKKEILVNGEVDRTKIIKLIEKEAIARNYNPHVFELLRKRSDYNRLLVSLQFLPDFDKIESLLISILDNKIRKKKQPGFSGVLVSEAGFNGISKDITYTSNPTYNPKVGLKPQRIAFEVDGNLIDIDNELHNELMDSYVKNDLKENVKPIVLGSQIIVPWRFRDKDGEILDINNFILEKDGVKYLDMSKIDSDILQMFGFRIPNQGPNSKALLEVVGFTPRYMGDLVVASRDLTVQMGSDFDIDKLYVYMYSTMLTEGRLHKITDGNIEDSKTKKRVLQNKNLGVHLAVMSNPSIKVQTAIKEPLDFGKLPEVAEEIYKANVLRAINYSTDTVNYSYRLPIAPLYQTNKYVSSRIGKGGTGVFSVSNTYNSQLEGIYFDILNDKKVPIRVYVTSEYQEKKVNGVWYSRLPMSYKYNIHGELKNNSHKAFQSAAVDEEKEQILSRLGINSMFYPSIIALLELGYSEEDISYIINVPSIKYYIEKASMHGDSTTPLSITDAKAKAQLETLKQFGFEAENSNIDQFDTYPLQQIKDVALFSGNAAIEQLPINYKEINLTVFLRFIKATELGETIQSIASSINNHSKGLGKTIFYVNTKIERVEDYSRSKTVIGYDDLLKNNVSGLSIFYSLFSAHYFANTKNAYDLLGIESDSFKGMYKLISLMSKRAIKEVRIESEAERKKDIFNEFKSYLFLMALNRLYSYLSDTPISQSDIDFNRERERLFIDTPTNKSLVTRTQEAKKKYGLSNSFINKLDTVTDLLQSRYKVVTYNGAAGLSVDETSTYQGFADLFNNPETVALGMDYILASYLSGGIQKAMQYVRYIPPTILLNSGFLTTLSNMDYNNTELFGLESIGDGKFLKIPPFVYQFFQNYPEEAPAFKFTGGTNDDFTPDSELYGNITTFKDRKSKQNSIYAKLIPKSDNVIKNGMFMPVIRVSFKLKGQKTASHYFLYAFDYSSGVYKVMDTATAPRITQYDPNNMIVHDVYNPVSELIKFDNTIKYVDAAEDGDFDMLPSVSTDTALTSKDNISIKEIQSILLKDTNDVYMDTLASYIYSIIKNDKNGLKVNQMAGYGAVNSYNNTTKTVTFAASDSAKTKRHLLHELLHHILNPITRNPVTPNQKRVIKELDAIRKAARNALQLYKMGDTSMLIDPRALENFDIDELLLFEQLYKQYVEAARKGPEALRQFTSNVNSNPEVLSKGTNFNELRDKYYAFIEYHGKNNPQDLSEFVNAVLDSYEVKNLLNNIKDFNEDNLFLSFINKIYKLLENTLKSMGITVRDGALLKRALVNIVSLTETTNSNTGNNIDYMPKIDPITERLTKAYNDTRIADYGYDVQSMKTMLKILSVDRHYDIEDFMSYIYCNFSK